MWWKKIDWPSNNNCPVIIKGSIWSGLSRADPKNRLDRHPLESVFMIKSSFKLKRFKILSLKIGSRIDSSRLTLSVSHPYMTCIICHTVSHPLFFHFSYVFIQKLRNFLVVKNIFFTPAYLSPVTWGENLLINLGRYWGEHP